jgi:hypothetical protein
MSKIDQNLAKMALDAHKAKYGIETGAVGFIEPAWKDNFTLAMDAQPTLITAPSSSIPAFLTTFIDADVLRVLTAKNSAAQIYGEERKGSFVDVTIVFPVVEQTGEVSSYGDFSQNGRSSANTNFPQRENYLFQTVTEWGELELERAGLAKIGWASELKMASIAVLSKFMNLTAFYGVAGLQNYGTLNSPGLSPALAPAPKTYNSSTSGPWITNGAVTATANEVYTDIQSLFIALVNQSNGNIDAESDLVLAMSPKSATALTTTNTFNVNVHDLLKKNFPKLRIETAVQFGALTASNPQGSAAGEIVQMFAESVEGQRSVYTAFSEKLRAGPVIRELSSFKQKNTSGSWGSVVRAPYAFAQMYGV